LQNLAAQFHFPPALYSQKMCRAAGTGFLRCGYFCMREGLVFDHIFPMNDPVSAKLMRLKADCLLRAGVIDPAERNLVYARSAAVPGFVEIQVPDAVPPELLPAIAREPLAPDAAAGRL
jgi:hypothetical protein